MCDCRLYDLVHFLEGWAPNLAFIEARLRCASPRSLAGVVFSQLELRKCQSPELRPGTTSIRSPLGSTVLLRCGATGVPGPEMSWSRANGHPLNGTGVWPPGTTVLRSQTRMGGSTSHTGGEGYRFARRKAKEGSLLPSSLNGVGGLQPEVGKGAVASMMIVALNLSCHIPPAADWWVLGAHPRGMKHWLWGRKCSLSVFNICNKFLSGKYETSITRSN